MHIGIMSIIDHEGNYYENPIGSGLPTDRVERITAFECFLVCIQ